MTCKFCSRYPQHVGNTKFAGNAGTAQLKHNTLSLTDSVVCDIAKEMQPFNIVEKPAF